MVDSRGLLKPVLVSTGLMDGKYTEVSAPELAAGDQIIIGVTAIIPEVCIESAPEKLNRNGKGIPVIGNITYI